MDSLTLSLIQEARKIQYLRFFKFPKHYFCWHWVLAIFFTTMCHPFWKFNESPLVAFLKKKILVAYLLSHLCAY